MIGGVIVVGDLLYDMVCYVDGRVVSGVDTFTPIHVSPGGSGANVASWLGRIGVESHFVGRVGRDVFGDYLTASLLEAGVEPHLGRDEALATGKVFVMVDGEGERTMITDRGASEAVRSADLPTQLFTSGFRLHMTGYMFSGGPRRETALLALRLAREAGMSVSVDPSSAPLLEEIGPERFMDWTAGAGVILPNLPEGRTLTGAGEPEDIVDALLLSYPEVVLKLGPQGALYAGREAGTFHVPVTGAEADARVDTTGAGDALCAGFLAGIISGSGEREALARGVELAGEVVRGIGGHPQP